MSWFRRTARSAIATAMRIADSASHAGRRRDVAEQIAAIGRPRSIMVVCYGNICRSPYLAALLRRALPDVAVSSAGFIGAGRSVPEHSSTLAAREGIDLSDHRSQLIPRDALDTTDLVVVMSERQARSLRAGFGYPRNRIVVAGDLDPVRGERREIRDPWNQPIEVFEASFARLARCASDLVAKLNGGIRRR
ncbi:MAG TPA: hypothetical protein VJR92_05485 [Gemmatimonadaceae bacterium]|nr:hypothetical protein [Gemmatimonadaceae bacterium]